MNFEQWKHSKHPSCDEVQRAIYQDCWDSAQASIRHDDRDDDPRFTAHQSEPAFPFHTPFDSGGHPFTFHGTTKRECFSAMAMLGLVSSPDWTGNNKESLAGHAVGYADALIAALNKEPKL